MPVIDTNVTDGPNIQASGQYRGTLEFIFDDGRVFIRHVRAPDAAAWANLIVDMAADVEAQVTRSDAEDAVNPDDEVTANLQAGIKDVAVAYLRSAWELEQAYDAFLLFDRFNTYRLAQGWSLGQVQAGLASAGLTAEEWEEMKITYQYLSGGGRPATMADAKTIQTNWESR